jgi:hypothetical protein
VNITKLDIKNGEIKQVIIGDIILPLKKKIKLSEAEKIESVLSFLEEYIDFSNIGTEKVMKNEKDQGFEWTTDELLSFLNQIESEKQKIFLKSLAESPDRLTWNHLKDIMKQKGEEIVSFSMAGILSCFARRAKHFGKKEDFWESNQEYKTGERYYRLKEPYKKIFTEYFGVK